MIRHDYTHLNLLLQLNSSTMVTMGPEFTDHCEEVAIVEEVKIRAHLSTGTKIYDTTLERWSLWGG